ncbi:MAG: hypothetical protein DME00_21720, partial [Candidatus Rokuibacteriota bacterium]
MSTLRTMRAVVGGGVVALAALGVVASGARAQHEGHGMTQPPAAPTTPAQSAGSRKVTMEELHQSGGVPRG